MTAALQELHDATAYYTTRAVVDDLLTLLDWPACGGRLLDPGAGDGAFLIRAVERLNLKPNDVDEIQARVEGWEIHKPAIDFARANLALNLFDASWDMEQARLAAMTVFKHADFIAPGPTQVRYRVAAGNPPYLRYARLPEKYKRKYANVPDWARQDLLHAFLARSIDVLEPNGRIAFVTADRWLFNESAGLLREKLGTRFGIENVIRLDPTTSFYQAKTRRKGTPPRIHPVAIVLGPNGQALTKAPVYIDSVKPPAGAVSLESVASIRLAPWLGQEGVFVIPLDAIPPSLAELPSGAYVECVDTDDIVNGVLQGAKRFALKTDRLSKPHANVVRHLGRQRHKLSQRAQRSQAVCRWAPPESWGPLPYQHEALLIPRIARELVTYRLPAGVLPINHNLTVVSSRIPIAELEAALAAPYARAWIVAHAARLEGGFLSITTNLLRKLPINL